VKLAAATAPYASAVASVDQTERERQERAYWTESPHERPGADSLHALTDKMAEGQVLVEKLRAYETYLREAQVILELGAGQCWTTCMLKKELGSGTVVVGSDIAPDAVASAPEWQRIFRVELDGTLACRSYQIPVRAESVDLVVAFAAAHHFGAHRRSLREIARVLRPGAHALYLHEPGCRRYIHGLARRRVNAKRPVVPEDVLVHKEIAALGREAGLAVEVIHAPTTTDRAAVEGAYYLVLQKLPWLQNVLPCTVDMVMTKQNGRR
jgi:SAM-dependent methyltransferase